MPYTLIVMLSFCFGTLKAKQNTVTYQQRELATIAALSAMPGVESQLPSHITRGRNTGITDSQLAAITDLIHSEPVLPHIQQDMMVRISEIEIFPEYLEEYNTILKEEAAASILKEPGVIAIFPMYQKENPTQLRIIEIYSNKEAYQAHLQTPHFLHYKSTTLKMVKSLKLVDMESLDKESMSEIFKKIK